MLSPSSKAWNPETREQEPGKAGTCRGSTRGLGIEARVLGAGCVHLCVFILLLESLSFEEASLN